MSVDFEREKLEQAKTLGKQLMDHALKSRLTKDEILAYRFANDFVPHVVAYGEGRVSLEAKQQQVVNHKLNVENSKLRSRAAELEVALVNYEKFNNDLIESFETLRKGIKEYVEKNAATVQAVIDSTMAAYRDGKLG